MNEQRPTTPDEWEKWITPRYAAVMTSTDPMTIVRIYEETHKNREAEKAKLRQEIEQEIIEKGSRIFSLFVCGVLFIAAIVCIHHFFHIL